jgi:hypothetical protein
MDSGFELLLKRERRNAAATAGRELPDNTRQVISYYKPVCDNCI